MYTVCSPCIHQVYTQHVGIACVTTEQTSRQISKTVWKHYISYIVKQTMGSRHPKICKMQVLAVSRIGSSLPKVLFSLTGGKNNILNKWRFNFLYKKNLNSANWLKHATMWQVLHVIQTKPRSYSQGSGAVGDKGPTFRTRYSTPSNSFSILCCNTCWAYTDLCLSPPKSSYCNLKF